ncbi:MAG: PAS domain-containing protein [Lachnospiraceae bacterium]|nr:PAS domain-containing protein [Lachnospiraceae bacterium]
MESNQLLDNKLFEAFANASDNIYIYVTDMDRNLTRWSKSAVEYFGIEDEYQYNTGEKWIESVHPDDRQMYIEDIMSVLSGTTSQHNCQYRARNRYGEYVWVECRGSIIKDKDGKPSLFAGIMTRLDNQNKYDNLTHLLTGFELARAPFEGQGALMIIGIDGFRNINSQYGISYGNKILVSLAGIIGKEAV